jgi:hypothetical protein
MKKETNFKMTDEMRELASGLTFSELLQLTLIEGGFQSAQTGEKYKLSCNVENPTLGNYKFTLTVKAEKI